jgi:ABC-2 type transport system permease protein
MTLLGMRLRGGLNSLSRYPWRYLFGMLFLGLVYWGIYAATRRGVRFIDGYPLIDTIADAMVQRGLEALFLILMLGVAFSVITTAITTLYSSDDLPFLLALPAPVTQVFTLKMVETYLSAALMPTLFTLPVLAGLGLERGAPLSYYPIALAAVLALYAVPVALGSFTALVLMRVAPAGRVKELATGVGVVLSAALIFSLRFLRPEELMALSPEEFEVLLARFASLEIGWLPSTWASQATWAALHGEVSAAAYVLAFVSGILLLLVARMAAYAYREGWIRALEAGSPRLDGTLRGPALWERLFRGPTGAIVVKDLRLMLRDATQWSQLLVLVALAGVYLVSVGSVTVELQRFRDALGTLNLMFMGFLLAGVGLRLAYPIVSLEGEGFWLLRTGPLSPGQIVMAKFWGALPPMLLLGGGLGYLAARLIDVSPTLAFVSPLAGVSAAVVTTALGIGLGAAFPRFDATNPAEIPMSPGGLLYMTLSLIYAAIMTVILAWPAWQALTRPDELYWLTAEGQVLLLALTLFTSLVAGLALLFGSRKLARHE